MILGEYPCCGEPLCLEIADGQLPRFQKENCPHCGEVVYHRHSRLDPKSWNEAAFEAEFGIDPETRQLKPRTPTGEQQ